MILMYFSYHFLTHTGGVEDFDFVTAQNLMPLEYKICEPPIFFWRISDPPINEKK